MELHRVGKPANEERAMPKQSRKRTEPKARSALEERTHGPSRLMEFPEVKGRTVEKVELSADPDFPCFSIRFQDNTDLTVVIYPGLTFRVDYSEWKAGKQKMLKRWPVVRSDRM